MSGKNEENKMAKMNAENGENKMATEPCARYKLHSRSQSRKVERKEVKLPHLKKLKDKGTGHQRKDETPKNNGNKFPNTYREDKGKIRGPSQMAKKKEFEKGEEVLLLSPNRGPHCDGRYIGRYVVSQRIDKGTYRIDTHEGRKKTQVSHANRLKKYVRREGPPRKLKNSEMPIKFEEKLSHLSVSERKDLEKLMNKNPSLFTDVARNCSSRMVFHSVEGKRMRKEEFSSPTLKYKRDEREVRQNMTKKEKRREKEFASSWLKYERVKTRGKRMNGRF